MKIKLTQEGYLNFTGHMGSVEFVDGVSEPLTAQAIQALQAVLNCELVDDEVAPVLDSALDPVVDPVATT